jgi:hypothetical protein
MSSFGGVYIALSKLQKSKRPTQSTYIANCRRSGFISDSLLGVYAASLQQFSAPAFIL